MLEAGQEWGYRTRPGESASTVVIGRVERTSDNAIIHISIRGLRVSNPQGDSGLAEEIAHMPIAESSFRQSITELRGVAQPDPDFEDGYRQWVEASGGVFGITVAEAISAVEATLSGAAT